MDHHTAFMVFGLIVMVFAIGGSAIFLAAQRIGGSKPRKTPVRPDGNGGRVSV